LFATVDNNLISKTDLLGMTDTIRASLDFGSSVQPPNAPVVSYRWHSIRVCGCSCTGIKYNGSCKYTKCAQTGGTECPRCQEDSVPNGARGECEYGTCPPKITDTDQGYDEICIQFPGDEMICTPINGEPPQ
jgi:hypothetical protein